MGTTLSEVIKYRCVDDCVQSGCPGHEMQLVKYTTVSVVQVNIDGNRYTSFDSNQIEALRNLLDQLLGK
jgi:hypothetical protein